MSDTPAVLIIANPTAGYHQPAWREPVTAVLRQLGPVEFVTPGSALDTTAVARAGAARGIKLIVAAGGDGTVHRVVNGLSGHDTHIGILPVGTGNDLAGHLEIAADPVEAARQMVSGASTDIDVICINGRRVFTSGVFCAIAESAYLANRMKSRMPWLGSLSYRIAAAQVIALRGGDELAGVFVANLARLGGNLRLPSGSVPTDGICEVATLKGGSRVRLAQTLLALSAGRPLPPGALVWERVTSTTLNFDRDVMAYGDGEDLGADREFAIEMEPAAIRVRVKQA